MESKPKFVFGASSSEGGKKTQPSFAGFGQRPKNEEAVSDSTAQPVSFGGKPESTGSNGFSFGGKSENRSSNPGFSFGTQQTTANDQPFKFGSSVTTNDDKPAFAFGSKANDNGNNKPVFGFGAKSEANGKQPALGMKAAESSKPSFGFASSENSKSAVPTAEMNEQATKPSFGFTLKKDYETEDKLNSSSSQSKIQNSNGEVESKDMNKKSSDELLKSYHAPSVNHLLHQDDDEDMDDKDDNDDDDDDEFFDIDAQTNLPIRHLNYSENDKSLFASKGKHLQFAISKTTEKGMLYLTENEKSESLKDKDSTKLFPFDLVPQLDKSSEYNEFLKKVYSNFEVLLKEKKFQNYLHQEDDEYMQIGVVSTLKSNRLDREITLKKIVSTLLVDLKTLIKEKMQNDTTFRDQWVLNYEEIINVLYLLNALHFSNDDETIVLFQQWIERIEIQPTQDLLEIVFKESDKPYQNYSFWNVYVKKLLLRGSFDTLIEDLKASQYEELQSNDLELFNLIEDFIKLLQSYDPIRFSYDISEFLKWKKVVVELKESSFDLDVNNVRICSEILDLLNILSGSNLSIEQSSDSWYETFISLFLFQMPSKKLIKEYIRKSLSLDTYEKPISGIESWDSICIELFNGRFLTMISSVEKLDKSIGTFLAILMEAAGLLDSYIKEVPSDDIIHKVELNNGIINNIERMIEDLALTYLNSQELFSIGVGILIDINSPKSRQILSELLPTFEIKTSDDFEWVLSVCSKLKLTTTMDEIRSIQGEKFYSMEMIPEALNCYAESRNNEKIVSVVWRLFEETLINKGLDKKLELELFESGMSDNNAILRQSLSPLYILNELFKKENLEENRQLWIDRLVSLFNFKYLESYYKSGLVLLIFDNMGNNSTFDTASIVSIMECLNVYEKSLSKNTDATHKSLLMYSMILEQRDSGYPSSFSELLKETRRELARRLSESFLEEL